MTLSRYGANGGDEEVEPTGSWNGTFGAMPRIRVVPTSEYRIHCTPLPKSVSTIRSYSPGTAPQLPPTVQGVGGVFVYPGDQEKGSAAKLGLLNTTPAAN